MVRRSVVAAALLAAVACPAVAEARIIDLRLSGNAGGMFGWGTTSNTQDMFRQAAGPGVGFELGFTLLIFDVSVNVLQIVNGSGFSATLMQAGPSWRTGSPCTSSAPAPRPASSSAPTRPRRCQ
jgi:hypothetical protein